MELNIAKQIQTESQSRLERANQEQSIAMIISCMAQ